MDEQWAELARGSREALDRLGYDIGPRCLPDEPERCGGTWRQHSLAHLAALHAVINHHWRHVGGCPEAADIFAVTYQAVAADLEHRLWVIGSWASPGPARP